MSQSRANPDSSGSRNRRIAFYVVTALTALMVLGLFGSIFAAFSPWISDPGEGPGYEFPKTHRWHDAQWAAHTGILLGGSALALLWRPERRPLLMQFLVAATLVVCVLTLIIGNAELLILIVPVGLMAFLYPDRRALLQWRSSGFNVALLGIAVVAALVALPYAVDMYQLQLDDVAGDEHAEHSHWAVSLLLTLNLLLAGVLASMRRPGSRTLGILGGLAFVYLGFVALTSYEGDPGAPLGIWSTTPAILAILAGLGYLGATLMEERLVERLPWLAGRPRTAG